jgi:hypothetical protein
MKKFKAITFFLILLSYGALLGRSPPTHYLTFVNRRNESVFIRCQPHPELQIDTETYYTYDYTFPEGVTYYALKYMNEEIGNLFAGGVGYDRIYEIKPNAGLTCYWIDDPPKWITTGPVVQFLALTPLEQLKAIYTDISVTDKDGNEIFTLEMIRPEDFITDGTSRGLIIK